MISKFKNEQLRVTFVNFILYACLSIILVIFVAPSSAIHIALAIPNVYYSPLKTATNHLPIVKVGPNQIVSENATVILNGTASDMDSGSKLSYAWKQVAGPTVKLV